MKRSISFLLALVTVLLLFLFSVGAEEGKMPADPEIGQIRNAVSETVGTDTPGAAVIFVKNGTLALMEGFGYENMETKALVTADTAFEIGELTGLFTAITVLKLADLGVLSLDADIAGYLPESFLRELQLAVPVTLRALLSGTAGFEGRQFDVLFSKDSYRFASLEEALLSDIPAQTLSGTGFTQYSYSSFGIALAAYTAQTVTGEDFAELVQREVLTPLGMTSTYLEPDSKTEFSSPAVGYVAKQNGVFREAENRGRSFTGLPFAIGAVSTPADLSSLLLWLLKPGADEILSAGMKEILFTATPTGALFATSTPGFCLSAGCCSIRGVTGYFSASLAVDRLTGRGVITLTNARSSGLADLPETLCGNTQSVTFVGDGTELPELKIYRGNYVRSTGERHTFVGRYALLSEGEKVTVNKEEGTISFCGMRLAQAGAGIFTDAAAQSNEVVLQFIFDENGEVAGIMTADGECYVPVRFYQAQPVIKLLFFAALLFAGWFLLYGFFSVLRYLARRGEADSGGVVNAIPGMFTFLMSLFVIWQILLGVNNGTATLSSTYRVLSVLALIFGVGAAVSFIVAFLSDLLDGQRLRRTARAAILFVLYALLCAFWGLVFL